jgi:hypothetical protein
MKKLARRECIMQLYDIGLFGSDATDFESGLRSRACRAK